MKCDEYKLQKIRRTNYRKSHLKKGQDWYVGKGQFLTLEETKKHLLKKMTYIKKALKKAYAVHSNFEEMLKSVETSGNLFTDVMELEEVLSATEIFVNDFIKAYAALEYQETAFKNLHLLKEKPSDDLPF